MTIQTERLALRPVEAADWRAIQRIWEDQNRSPYAQYDTPNDTSDGAVRARIARWEEYGRGREHLFFAVCLKSAVIGYVAFNTREKGYELGYCFHSDAHGKGYARESIACLLAHMREEHGAHFIARTALKNLPSVRLLAALGFTLTGTERVSFYKDEAGEDIWFDGGVFERA